LIPKAREGYTSLCGSDYSAPAIELAKQIATKEQIDSQFEANIEFVVDDLLDSKLLDRRFDLITDKGTFDAIALNQDRSMRTKYRESIVKLLNRENEDSLFVITSCNFTEVELREFFQDCFAFVRAIKYPTFKFAGHEGSKVSTVAFGWKK
jgi:hypothetical protein